jgi:hypothetical protein
VAIVSGGGGLLTQSMRISLCAHGARRQPAPPPYSANFGEDAGRCADRAAQEALGFEAGFPVSFHFVERRERESVSALDCLLIDFLRE